MAVAQLVERRAAAIAGSLAQQGRVAAGVEHRIPWDGTDDTGRSLASGVYFVKVVTPDFTRTQKVALIK